MLQGMNFIAGALLLFMDEEDAFWCLAIISEDLLPGYFSLIMVAPQVSECSMLNVSFWPFVLLVCQGPPFILVIPLLCPIEPCSRKQAAQHFVLQRILQNVECRLMLLHSTSFFGSLS